jgi:hypothetical protein
MFSSDRKQTLKTQRTQDGKNNRNQQQHCDEIDLLKANESLTGLAQ